MHNHYETLEIPDFSDADTIKAAHRKLSKQYHPDLNGGDKRSEEKFKQIQSAYEKLRDPDEKEWYDQDLYRYQAGGSIPGDLNTPPYYDPTAQQPVGWFKSTGSRMAAAVLVFMVIKLTLGALQQTRTPTFDAQQFNMRTDSLKGLLFPKTPADTPAPRPPVRTFQIGSPKEDVRLAIGEPQWATKHGATEMWSYDTCLVIFTNGKVSRYDNIGKSASGKK